MPSYMESAACCEKFAEKFQAVTGSKYQKSDTEIYNKLNQYGDEERALEIALKRHKTRLRDGILKPSKMYSATTLYQLVGEIQEKIKLRKNR